MNEREKLGLLDPLAITAFVAAFMGDIAFLFVFGALIPVIGLVILATVLGMHYFTGLIMGAFAIPRLAGFIPKLVVVAGIILPLPTLILSLTIGMLLQNRFVQTAAVIAVGVATGGTGAIALRGASMASEVAEGTAAETGEASAVSGKGTAKAARGETEEGTAAKKSSGAKAGEKEIPPQALGGEEEIPEKLKRKLFQETPTASSDDEYNKEETVEEDDENNEIDLRDLRKAA
ncbi:MAG: hypothetical protein HY432_03920 [Candidatus Liptonbacteria bacterium]|nr:hypothetical protein [Candidatus Liptonbacteria bacterium]